MTHQGGADRAHTPANDVVALQNEQVGGALREASHQRDLLKDYFNHLGALAGQEDPSVLFRTTQLFQEQLSKLVFQRIKKNPKKSFSGKFARYF